MISKLINQSIQNGKHCISSHDICIVVTQTQAVEITTYRLNKIKSLIMKSDTRGDRYKPIRACLTY